MKQWWKTNWYQVAVIALIVILFGVMFIDGFYILKIDPETGELFAKEQLAIGNAYEFIFKSKLEGSAPVALLLVLFPLTLIGQIGTHVHAIIKGESRLGPIVEMLLVWTLYFLTWSTYFSKGWLNFGVYIVILLAITIIDILGAYFRNRYETHVDEY